MILAIRALLSFSLSISLLVACTPKSVDTANAIKKPSGSGRKDQGPVVVRTFHVQIEKRARPVTVFAVLTGRQQADVYTKVPGRLASLAGKEGEAIRKGQLLFRVERSDPGESFLETPVLSPFTGWIGQWHIQDLGAQLNQQEPVVTIVDDRELRAQVYLPATDWLQVNMQTPVTMVIAKETRSGRVAGVSRAAEVGSGSGTVNVLVDNPERDWRSGLIAAITLDLASIPRLIIPAQALILTDQGAYVYIVTGDKAERAKVSFDLFNSDQVEITAGLNDGAEVVTQGMNNLGAGSVVKILPNEGGPKASTTPP